MYSENNIVYDSFDIHWHLGYFDIIDLYWLLYAYVSLLMYYLLEILSKILPNCWCQNFWPAGKTLPAMVILIVFKLKTGFILIFLFTWGPFAKYFLGINAYKNKNMFCLQNYSAIFNAYITGCRNNLMNVILLPCYISLYYD